MPQARKAISTTAANGLRRPRSERADHRGGHRIGVLARDHGGRVGMRERGRDRVEDHERADAQQRDPDRPRDVASGVARLLGGADAGVEADEHPARRRPARRAAPRRSIRPTAPRRPSVSRQDREVLLAKGEQQGQPDADRGDDLGRDARLHHPAQHPDPERSRQRADDHEDHPRRARARWACGSMPSEGQRPGGAKVGDRRVGHRVGADRDPAGEPAVGAAHQPAASTGRRRRRSGTPKPARRRPPAAGTARRAQPAAPRPRPGPATSMPTSTTAYSPTTGEMAAKPSATLS